MTESNSRMYWLHALTPLHAGSGRGVGFIDLPIIREKVTKWPIIPGSTVKGVLADYFGATEEKRKDNNDISKLHMAAFGRSDEEGETANSGSLVFTDARLVCLPVRSLFGTFSWITSPLALRRLKRDMDTLNIITPVIPTVDTSKIKLPYISSVLKETDNKVYLEDLDFEYVVDNSCTKEWADKIASLVFTDTGGWQEEFKKRFAVIPDDTFNFLCETGTEVNARIRINPDKKIVEKGALWYEESLPAETILAGFVWCDRVFSNNGTTKDTLFNKYCPATGLNLQIGGKATVGKGRVNCKFI